MSLHEMLLQAPEMTQGQGTRQTIVKQADAARSTAQNALGIDDPENVRVTRRADGSYALSRPAAAGSGPGQPFATLDPRTNRITLIPGADGRLSQAALDMAAQGTPKGTPIYHPGGQPPSARRRWAISSPRRAGHHLHHRPQSRRRRPHPGRPLPGGDRQHGGSRAASPCRTASC